MSEPIKLQETWDEAVKIFEDIIGDGVDPEHQNGEYIKGKILGKSSKFSEKGKAVKTVNCVLALSAIAADAAAPICSPGPICLKGLAFLVDTAITFRQFYRVRSIRDVVEGLSVHLKDVEDTMNVHKLTPGGISQDLLDTCLQILRAFLDICTAYANVKKDSKKFTGTIKMVAKAGIKYDQGITDSLKTIEGLATRVGRLKENDVWKGNVENISSRVQSNNRNTISEVMCRHDKDIWKTWTTAAHNEHRERFTPQVGAWIETDEKLLTWAKLEERIATPTIILESPEGHGKSFICSEIIAQLASKDKPLSPKSKVSVAYFYFKPTGTSTQSKSEMKISLHEALMAIAWQLSQDDVSYQGFLADLCRNQQNHPTSAKDLWRNWIADYKPQNGSSKSIFIILDGIDQSAWKTGGDREALQDILHNINAYADNGLNIRLLLSCQESFHRNLGDRWKEVSVQIDLRTHLSKDVSAFIEQKMDYVCRHFDETDAKAWREKHESNLRSLRNCKLASLNTVFEAIGEESDSNKVSRIIGEALSNLRNYQLGIKKQVRKLNQNLDPAEIEDLNEMIACIVLMEQWPTLTQIQDILQLRAGNEVKKSTETLENQIKSYGRLLEVSDGVVSSADTMYYFQEHDTKQNPELPEDFDSALELDSSFRRLFRSPRDQQKDVIGNTESKRSTQEPTERPNQRANQESNQEQQMVGNNNRGKVDEKEVAIVERLLLATCGEDLYKRFGFDSFFDHLRNNTADSVQPTAHVQNNIAPKTLPSTSKIQFETHDGHLRIISFLLKSICLPDAKKLYKSLHNYASTYLFEHIKELDISEMEELQERVEKISRNLLSFFKNKKCVKIWLEPDMIEDVKFFDWAETAMKRTTEWFQTLDSKGYLYACLGEYTEPPTREELLSQPIEMLANQWLQREEWDVEFVFDRLLACYKLSGKLTKSKGPSDARDESDVESSDSDSSSDDSSSVTSDDSAIAPDLIYRVEGLARDELKLEEGNEVVDRTHNRVIETLLYYEHYSEVIERSKEIRENQKQNWLVNWYLAQALDEQDKHSEALDALNAIEDQVLQDDFRKNNKDLWERIIQSRWDSSKWEGKSYSEAEDACETLLEKFPDHYPTIEALLRFMEQFDESSKREKFLLGLSKKALPNEAKFNVLAGLLHYKWRSADFHRMLFLSLEDKPDSLKDAYKDASNRAEPGSSTHLTLQYYYGVALSHQKPSKRDSKLARKLGSRLPSFLRKFRRREIPIANKALSVWEECLRSILVDEPTPKHDYEKTEILDKIAEELVSSYTKLANKHSARSDPETIQEYIDKTKRLKAWKDRSLGNDNHFLTLALARLHHLHDQVPEAQQCLKNYVASGVQLLSDPTPRNDWQGCLRLIEASKAVDDDVNALAACSLLFSQSKEYMWSMMRCDGGCGATWPHGFADWMYMCKDCADVQLDDTCYKRIGDIIREKQVCDKDHRFLEVPTGASMEENKVKEGNVFLEGQEVSQKEWLDKVREKYGI